MQLVQNINIPDCLQKEYAKILANTYILLSRNKIIVFKPVEAEKIYSPKAKYI
jgi:hypothetical protein